MPPFKLDTTTLTMWCPGFSNALVILGLFNKAGFDSIFSFVNQPKPKSFMVLLFSKFKTTEISTISPISGVRVLVVKEKSGTVEFRSKAVSKLTATFKYSIGGVPPFPIGVM